MEPLLSYKSEPILNVPDFFIIEPVLSNIKTASSKQYEWIVDFGCNLT
jgi:hypothetical protein